MEAWTLFSAPSICSNCLWTKSPGPEHLHGLLASHLVSSESQQCNPRQRGQGWLSGLLGKAGVYADHPGPLPNMALSFGLPTVHESAWSRAHCEGLSTDPLCTFGLQSHCCYRRGMQLQGSGGSGNTWRPAELTQAVEPSSLLWQTS